MRGDLKAHAEEQPQTITLQGQLVEQALAFGNILDDPDEKARSPFRRRDQRAAAPHPDNGAILTAVPPLHLKAFPLALQEILKKSLDRRLVCFRVSYLAKREQPQLVLCISKHSLVGSVHCQKASSFV